MLVEEASATPELAAAHGVAVRGGDAVATPPSRPRDRQAEMVLQAFALSSTGAGGFRLERRQRSVCVDGEVFL